MMRIPRRAARVVACAAILLVVAVAVAIAHETWLMPSNMRAAVGEKLTLDLTSGMTFPADDFAIDPARVTRTVARLGGNTLHLREPSTVTGALRYTWTPTREGVATLGVELAPRQLELKPELIEEYFTEIRASAALRAQWDSVPAPKRWREMYRKHATSFVRVGNPTRDSSWRTALGFGLEIVPENDPTTTMVGDSFHVRVLRDGAPLPDFAVVGMVGGDTAAFAVKTDTHGRAAVVFPSAGVWLLTGTNLRRVHEKALEWRSDFATMTLEVESRQ